MGHPMFVAYLSADLKVVTGEVKRLRSTVLEC